MSNKIKKNDRLYQDALIWMGYRYAIGLTETGEAVKQYKLFRDIEYDTSEFHALAAEISNYLRRKKIKDVVDLRNRLQESDLIWYSFHYAIGRHTYAASHCHDIVQYGKDVLSPERKAFTALDIRRELSYRFHVGFNFKISYELEGKHDPVDYLMVFLQQNKIYTDEQLAKYRRIEVAKNSDGVITYHTEKATEKESYRMGVFSMNFWDYLGWADLASYFDPDSHKRCRTKYKGVERVIEYFDSWVSGEQSTTELSYHKVKRPIESYEARPYICSYISEEYIVEDEI